MFHTLGNWVYAKRRGIAVCWGILLLVSLFFAVRLPQILRDPIFASEQANSTIGERLLEEKLQVPTCSVLVLVRDDQHSILTADNRRKLQQIADKVKRLPYVSTVTLPDAGQTAEGQHVGYLTIGFNRAEDIIVKQLPKLRETIQQVATGSLQLRYTGGPVFLEQENHASVSDLKHVEMIALPLTLLVLLLGFRTWTAALLPLITGLASAVVSLALLYGLGHWLQFSVYVLNIPTTLGIAVGVDYSLLIVNRFREELQCSSVRASVVRTFDTSGRALFFSGLIVMIGIVSLVFFDSIVLRTVMIGAILVVCTTVCCALTLIPALLGLLGERINRGAILPKRLRASDNGGWTRFAHFVMRHPWAAICVSLLLLGLMISPLRAAKFSVPGLETLPNSYTARQNMETLERDFGEPTFEPVILTLEKQQGAVLASTASLAQLRSYLDWVERQPGIAKTLSVFTPVVPLPRAQGEAAILHPPQAALQKAVQTFAQGPVTQIILRLQGDPNGAQALQLVDQIRQHPLSGYRVFVTGPSVRNHDFDQDIIRNLPLALTYVFLITFGLLLLIFRSLVIPLKALVMNSLSLLASFGLLVWLYVEGHGQHVLGNVSNTPIDSFVPLFVFAFVFGTSMDYEVFMLSRIQEEYLDGRSNEEATAKGLAITSRLITSAALVLICHTGSFFFTDVLPVQQIGIGLALAITIDATIIRLLLVPAVMKLFGDWNWKLPKLIDRLL